MVNDMTKGSPLRLIIAFAVPMLIGNIFQQVYNFVDAAVVGRFIGANALAAVGATGSIISVLVSWMIGLTSGGGIIISQCFGMGDFKKLRETVTGLIYIVIAMSIIISVLGVSFSKHVLLLLGTPESVLSDAVTYTRIMFMFLGGMACYNTANAILRSLGDSRTPLYALIISSVLNVFLDLLFVVVFKAGVAGAAIATIIAQTLSAAFCIAHMIRHRAELNLVGLSFKTSKEMISTIIKAGLPGALESCMISLGTMSVQRLVNSFGASAMAAYTASTKIDNIAIAPIVSVANAISIYTGQNTGAGNTDRIKKGLYQSLALLICACIVITSLIVIFRYQLLGIFLDPSQAWEAIEIGGQYLTIVCVAYVVAAFMRCYLNVLRGAGDVNVSAVSGVTELCGRVLFAYMLVRPLGITGIWIATPIAWAMGAFIPITRYYSGKWMTKKLV
ncbi:MAG: MATE family efflux transporter [Oscillospiraceae bacterium]|nr:MATE family efflux transporter [Oscillospiraceae bacterium]